MNRHETRPPNVPTDRQALFAEWQARARELGIDFGARDRAVLERDPGTVASSPSPHLAADGARRGVRFAIAHLTERQAIIEEQSSSTWP